MKVFDGRITSRFGYRVHPVTGQRSMHNGIDIAAPVGTPVYCPCDGSIADIYMHHSGGLTVIVHANDGMRYGFCHLSLAVPRKGATVRKGQLIASSGNSGRSTGPHLHFSVRKISDPSSWVDPTPHLTIL